MDWRLLASVRGNTVAFERRFVMMAIKNYYDMYPVIKTIFVLLAAILLYGCRTAKPTVASEASTDSLTISTNTSLSISHDSVIIMEKTGMLTEDKVEFVEGGGYVILSADGILSISGVASVSSSRLKSYGRREEAESLDMQAQSKDSVVAAKRATSYSESKPTASPAIYGCKLKWVGLILLALMIIILIPKFKKKL